MVFGSTRTHIRTMSLQFDLFADNRSPVSGLRLAGPVIAQGEAEPLRRAIDASGLEPFRFQQWTGHRLTRSYGWHYDFAGGGVVRAEEVPGWLLPARAAMARAFGLPAERFEQALLIRYDPGAGIGWHRDRPQFGQVMGLSLGAPAVMRLRKRHGDGFSRATFALEEGHAYLLDGAARTAWEHSIVPGERIRWSVTFRTLA